MSQGMGTLFKPRKLRRSRTSKVEWHTKTDLSSRRKVERHTITESLLLITSEKAPYSINPDTTLTLLSSFLHEENIREIQRDYLYLYSYDSSKRIGDEGRIWNRQWVQTGGRVLEPGPESPLGVNSWGMRGIKGRPSGTRFVLRVYLTGVSRGVCTPCIKTTWSVCSE